MTAAARVSVHGLPADAALRDRVARRLGALLARIGPRPVSARAAFVDDNGPRGGVAIRCALTVRLPRRRLVRAEHVAATPRAALDGAFAALERELAARLERDRKRRRYPKKYYVARRLLAAPGAGAEPDEGVADEGEAGEPA